MQQRTIPVFVAATVRRLVLYFEQVREDARDLIQVRLKEDETRGHAEAVDCGRSLSEWPGRRSDRRCSTHGRRPARLREGRGGCPGAQTCERGERRISVHGANQRQRHRGAGEGRTSRGMLLPAMRCMRSGTLFMMALACDLSFPSISYSIVPCECAGRVRASLL